MTINFSEEYPYIVAYEELEERYDELDKRFDELDDEELEEAETWTDDEWAARELGLLTPQEALGAILQLTREALSERREK